MQTPQLSILVPVYNERDQVEPFLVNLLAQQHIRFELLFCDGGSSDDTVKEISRLLPNMPFGIRIIDCVKGRAQQMNTGVNSAVAATLFFLHIDSRFSDSRALHKSWSQLNQDQQDSGGKVAGRFSLQFNRSDDSDSELYYHMECKARLDRDECTHGDQGFMLSREFFDDVGPFDDLYPVAEDTRFADHIRGEGRWLLFPEIIQTSARRFEVEGIGKRQTFSSILMNFTSIGWTEYFHEAGDIYATQDCAGRLKLAPYLLLVQTLLKRQSFWQRLRFWYGTGRYVRDNSWQIPFYFDTRYQYRFGLAPGSGVNRRLLFHDKWIEPLLDHAPSRIVAGFLTWLWLQFSLIRFRAFPE